MGTMRRRALWLLPAIAVGAVAVAATGAASGGGSPQFSPVPTANRKANGFAPASRLAGGLVQLEWARGSVAVENPQGIVTHYGYENDVPSTDDPTVPQMVP